MTNPELIDYFKDKTLPDSLRLDRATTQHNVKEAVERNIANILASPQDQRSHYRLQRLMEALETPYDGAEIPKLF